MGKQSNQGNIHIEQAHAEMVERLTKNPYELVEECALQKLAVTIEASFDAVSTGYKVEAAKKFFANNRDISGLCNKFNHKQDLLDARFTCSDTVLPETLEVLTPEQAHLLHMALGIVGEASELLDAVVKHVFERKVLDIKNVVEELGDLEFYMEGMRSNLVDDNENPITRNTILEANFNKLAVRYSSGTYSDAQAQERADKK